MQIVKWTNRELAGYHCIHGIIAYCSAALSAACSVHCWPVKPSSQNYNYHIPPSSAHSAKTFLIVPQTFYNSDPREQGMRKCATNFFIQISHYCTSFCQEIIFRIFYPNIVQILQCIFALGSSLLLCKIRYLSLAQEFYNYFSPLLYPAILVRESRLMFFHLSRTLINLELTIVAIKPKLLSAILSWICFHSWQERI